MALPERLVLRRTRGLRPLAPAIVAALGGVALLVTGDAALRPAGVAVLALAVVVGAVGGLATWTSASSLVLTREGFVERVLFRAGPLVRWESVRRFDVWTARGAHTLMRWLIPRQLVVYDLAPGAAPRPSRRMRAFTGHDAALADTYGMTGEALAALLSRWREGQGAPRRNSAPSVPGSSPAAPS
jgi:hypothetical protein